ncbi:MAG: biosynthetic-type acetolactate synthase large subunit [Spirochaetales bacterium]|nr:biosynthetic-type acetolactate synthase large subunit [Spirochaetales bacterium]
MNMTGSQILMECLVEQGVDTVFGIPGGSVINLYDELYKNAHRIRHILTAHEQGASHAADGYARATGKPGVVLVTSGPGATNIVTGLATAYMDSIPLVAITGNVPLHLIGKDSFQEVDITGVTAPITKHNYMVKDIDDLASCVRKAFAIATTGRPGPVLVDIPKDLTAQSTEWVPQDPAELETFRRSIEAKWLPELQVEQLEIAARLLNEAKRPLIFAGGGIVGSGASEQLRDLSEKLLAPVALSLMGHGALPSRHPLCTGLIGMHGTKASNTAASKADLIVALGVRFSDRVISNASGFARHAQVLHIDIDPAEINKNIKTYHSLRGNVKEILARLLPMVNARESSEWNGDIEAWKKIRPSSHHRNTALHPRFVIEEIHAQLGDDAIVTTEVGQHQMWAAQFYPFTKPRSFLTSGGLGTMGFGTGAAIGAQVAFADRRVVNLAGDGSFRMNGMELSTIAYYGLPLLIVIFNNGTLGMVRQWQTMFYDASYAATTLDRPPDFVKLADAYGIRAWRASDELSFRDALQAALSLRAPALIDCRIDIDEHVLPMVPSGKSIEEQIMEPVGP